MNSLFVTFKNDILEIFKKNYQKMILKNPEINFLDILAPTLEECNIPSSNDSEHQFLKDWFLQINELSFIGNQFEKPFFELLIHSPKNGLRINQDARISFTIENLTEFDFQLALDTLALKHHQKWNYQSPFVSFSAFINNKNYRFTLIHYSCNPNEISKLFIRAQPESRPSLDMFHLEKNETNFLENMIREHMNFLISGGTGSGKTTFLRSLIPLIDSKEHLVVLEDTYEILNQHQGQTSLLAQKDTALKSLKDYCAYALRMSPDRLIIGEMRSNEVVPFVLAMNTGHKGLMSTIHANSAIDAIHRAALLFTLYSETRDISYGLVLKLLCKNIDYVIHLENKKIKEIIRVIGSEGDTPFFEDVSA